jgi:Rrf2 family iron-sulfur cluster assembly transcriptional regulator
MRITTAGRYALRSMLDLALHQEHGPVLRQDIADRQQISAEYIAQLFRLLTRDGLLRSVLGPGGGYLLGRDAANIRVGDVIRTVEGPFNAVACLDPNRSESCCRQDTCVTRRLWLRLSQTIEEFLDGVTLANLVGESLAMAGGGDRLLDALDGLPAACDDVYLDLGKVRLEEYGLSN